ncbi:hypothetical protein X777_08836 [Ooceraea biroi]|uniref:Uncharacterized protein n=1 Tax=Ooceraea biroi TaxID=2015173 RepID=A0A026W6D3_OOCBI|nr:hypothetical protein X777_08836 [Ooceraea biroi]
MEMNKSDKTNAIIDVKLKFLSECTINDKTIVSRKIRSDPDLESNTNYDDICGPWKFDTVPLHRSRCSYLSPKLITSEDITRMRKQQDKKSVLLFLGECVYLIYYNHQ